MACGQSRLAVRRASHCGHRSVGQCNWPPPPRPVFQASRRRSPGDQPTPGGLAPRRRHRRHPCRSAGSSAVVFHGLFSCNTLADCSGQAWLPSGQKYENRRSTRIHADRMDRKHLSASICVYLRFFLFPDTDLTLPISLKCLSRFCSSVSILRPVILPVQTSAR